MSDSAYLSGSAIMELDSSCSTSHLAFDHQKTADISTDAVFMETVLDNDIIPMESFLSTSPPSRIGVSTERGYCGPSEEHQGFSNHNFTWKSNLEDSSSSSSELDSSTEVKELETVFEDDVLNNSSSYHKRSSSISSTVSGFRDRSGSTWSTMTLCDCECSNNNMASGYRKRSYSSTSTYNEPSFCGGSGQLQCSHSNISGCRQRSASIGSTVPNPLHQSHRMSIQYWKSAFTFLNTKGKFVCSTV